MNYIELKEVDILSRAEKFGPGNPPAKGLDSFAHQLYFNFSVSTDKDTIESNLEVFLPYKEYYDDLILGAIKTDFKVSNEGLQILFILFELNEFKQSYAIRRKNDSVLMDSLRHSVYKRDGYKCLKCDSKKMLSLDHIIPMIKGGLTVLDNLQTLCRKCNSIKGVQTISYLKP